MEFFCGVWTNISYDQISKFDDWSARNCWMYTNVPFSATLKLCKDTPRKWDWSSFTREYYIWSPANQRRLRRRFYGCVGLGRTERAKRETQDCFPQFIRIFKFIGTWGREKVARDFFVKEFKNNKEESKKLLYYSRELDAGNIKIVSSTLRRRLWIKAAFSNSVSLQR